MEHGKITKLNAWKSGKGSFIGIDGNEYVILAQTDAKVGDAVEYEIDTNEIGTKFFSGKAVLSKLLLPLEAYVQPARDEDKVRSAPVAVVPFRAHDVPKLDAREEYWKAKEQRDLEAKPIEIRLRCLESAAQVYSGAQETTTISTAEMILALAEKFEDYAKNGKKVQELSAQASRNRL